MWLSFNDKVVTSSSGSYPTFQREHSGELNIRCKWSIALEYPQKNFRLLEENIFSAKHFDIDVPLLLLSNNFL